MNGEAVAEPAQTATTAEPAAGAADLNNAPARVLIVEDSVEELEPGQLGRSEFLALLRAEITNAAEDALSGTIWSALGCPWIDRWFNYYGERSSSQIERAIYRYAPEANGITTAGELIPVICGRVRNAINVWTTTGEMTQDLPTDLPVAGAGEEDGDSHSGTGNVFRKEREGASGESNSPEVIQGGLGSGSPLDTGVRSDVESAYGEDFSGVRVHTGASAAAASESLNARALTVGEDIAFGANEYQPGTPIGDALIAHELAHVMQQRSGAVSGAAVRKGSNGSGSLEEDADQAAVGAVISRWGGTNGWLRSMEQSALPRLRSGLRLQRCGKAKSKPSDPHAVYEEKLNEAVTKLSGVTFGRCEGEYVGADPHDMYDTRYWEVKPDGDDAMLVLKPGKSPSDAIDAMFDNLDLWSVDCAQFIQVAQLYAMRHALGADEFNQRAKGMSFTIKPHWSTLIKAKVSWNRGSSSASMKRSDGVAEARSIEQIIADLPVGSRVMWTNKDARASAAFRNENTIKLGPDLFAATGFGAKNTFTRSEIELLLARAQNPTADAAYISANIFIAEIDHYDTP